MKTTSNQKFNFVQNLNGQKSLRFFRPRLRFFESVCFTALRTVVWQKNWGNLCRKIKLHKSWWEPEKVEEKNSFCLDTKSLPLQSCCLAALIGDLSDFFANFCINSFPRTFTHTQQSLTSRSRFAKNQFHISRETLFSYQRSSRRNSNIFWPISLHSEWNSW